MSIGDSGAAWHAGFLGRRDATTPQRLLTVIAERDPALSLALNQPYQIDDVTDWFIPRHAETRGLKHALIEIRNDELRDDAGIARWADLLTAAISEVLT